jgi:hypothetical protein
MRKDYPVATKSSRETLFRFLDDRVFKPIINASPQRFPASEHRELKLIQELMVAERTRYRSYYKASEIRLNFMKDIDSDMWKDLDQRLTRLELPRFTALKDEFVALSKRLRIQPSKAA